MTDENILGVVVLCLIALLVVIGFVTWWFWQRLSFGLFFIFEFVLYRYGLLGVVVAIITTLLLPIVSVPLILTLAFWLGKKKFQFDREDEVARQKAFPTDQIEYRKWQNREPPYDA